MARDHPNRRADHPVPAQTPRHRPPEHRKRTLTSNRRSAPGAEHPTPRPLGPTSAGASCPGSTSRRQGPRTAAAYPAAAAAGRSRRAPAVTTAPGGGRQTSCPAQQSLRPRRSAKRSGCALAVDVTPLEHLPFLGPEAGPGCEDRQGRVHRRQLGGDRLGLIPAVGADRSRRRLPVAAGEQRRVRDNVALADRSAEGLSERLHDAEAAPLR